MKDAATNSTDNQYIDAHCLVYGLLGESGPDYGPVRLPIGKPDRTGPPETGITGPKPDCKPDSIRTNETTTGA